MSSVLTPLPCLRRGMFVPHPAKLISLAAVCMLAFACGFSQKPENLAADENSEQISDGVRLTPKAARAAVARTRNLLVRVESFGGDPPVRAATTGVLVSSTGHILTSSYQLPAKPLAVTCTLSDGKRRIAKVLGRDNTRQLCLLKVEGADLPTPTIVRRDSLQVGQYAIAVGAALGVERPTLSLGIISATSRISGRAVQVDCNTGPGNYGGLVLDIEGGVIGVCSPLHPQANEGASGVAWCDSGIGFAVPLDGLAPVIAAMERGEVLEQGWLGIDLDDTPGGPVVKAVAPNSPAAGAKLAAGDRITHCGGAEVQSRADLKRLLGTHLAGEDLEIAWQRDGNPQQAIVRLTPLP
ncbi:S1C family serine protease [Lignipirellula cremea]|uniref:Serine protease HtrA n=1 Tax=Lignipirellula cremea TaxID=2528010 RepID=A0A518E1Y8_9BACT|nr:trypsin-like peptidase domain-containing protein [Lignipirellula cremea]QDU98107.1 Putative serine protease HtrA [Lignipirellula cremea]